MAIQIQYRRDLAATWTSVNPILAEGEPGYETDTGKFKVGNGTNTWSALSYSSGPAGATGATGAGVPTGGTTGQVLAKNSATNYDTAWITAGAGTVTSVDLSVPTGLSVSGNPVTSSGTLAVTYAAGYSIPTTANQTNWSTAYGWGNHASAGYLTGITGTQVTTALGYTPYNATNPSGYTSNTGTVTSVAATAGTGISVSGSPITTSGTLTITNTAPMTYAGAGIAVSTGSAWGTSLTAPSGTIVGTTDTQTLTNKRINLRVLSQTSTASLAINSDSYDQAILTAQAASLAIPAPTGTPVNGQKLTIRIKDNATPQTISWTTTSGGFRIIGVTLPTTTVASKVVYVGAVYNSDETFWDVVSVAQQA